MPFCPMIDGECKQQDCMWYNKHGSCAVAELSENIDILVQRAAQILMRLWSLSV